MRRSLEETKDEVRRFFEQKRLVSVRAEADYTRALVQMFRLILDIDERMILEFEWGNDSRVIDMLGEQLGHQAAREIRQMNMRRRVD